VRFEKECNYRGIITVTNNIQNCIEQLYMWTKLLGIICVDFDVIYQLLIRYPAFVRYWRKSESIMGQYSSYL